jgi:hypothetical protein
MRREFPSPVWEVGGFGTKFPIPFDSSIWWEGLEKKKTFKNMYIVHLSDRRGNLPHRTDHKNCLSKHK